MNDLLVGCFFPLDYETEVEESRKILASGRKKRDFTTTLMMNGGVNDTQRFLPRVFRD